MQGVERRPFVCIRLSAGSSLGILNLSQRLAPCRSERTASDLLSAGNPAGPRKNPGTVAAKTINIKIKIKKLMRLSWTKTRNRDEDFS